MAQSKDSHAVVMHWILQRKQAEKDRDKALEEGKAWFRRAQLAMSRGEMELASAAKEEAQQARERYDAAARRVEVARMEADVARTQVPADPEAGAGLRRAAHTLDEFRKLGIGGPDPLLAEPQAPESDATSSSTVASTGAGSDDTVLTRLRARMARGSGSQ